MPVMSEEFDGKSNSSSPSRSREIITKAALVGLALITFNTITSPDANASTFGFFILVWIVAILTYQHRDRVWRAIDNGGEFDKVYKPSKELINAKVMRAKDSKFVSWDYSEADNQFLYPLSDREREAWNTITRDLEK